MSTTCITLLDVPELLVLTISIINIILCTHVPEYQSASEAVEVSLDVFLLLLLSHFKYLQHAHTQHFLHSLFQRTLLYRQQFNNGQTTFIVILPSNY